jgi:hypothetical protein
VIGIGRNIAMKKNNKDQDLVEAAADAVTDAQTVHGFVERMVITKAADLEFAVNVTAEVKAATAKVEDERKTFTTAARQIIDKANALFKPASDSLKKTEKLLKEKIVEGVDHMEEKRRKAIEAAGRGDTEALAVAEANVVPDIPGLSIRTLKRYEAIEPDELKAWLFANDLWGCFEVDMKAVEKLIIKETGIVPPGVKLVEKRSVAIGGKK